MTPPRLRPLAGLSGAAPLWQAEAPHSWFDINCDLAKKGGWLRLAWRASFTAPVCRPVLRLMAGELESAPAYTDILLSAAPMGQQFWCGFVPAGTVKLMISPQAQPGHFGFDLVEARWVRPKQAFFEALLREPMRALHALGALLIGRSADWRLLLNAALNTTPLARYHEWAARRGRKADWAGLDAPPSGEGPSLHLFLPADKHEAALASDDPAETRSGVVLRRIAPDLLSGEARLALKALLHASQEAPDDDVLMLLPADAQLTPWAAPALRAAAARAPETAFFYGDEARCLATGRLAAPRLRPGFGSALDLHQPEGKSRRRLAAFGLAPACARMAGSGCAQTPNAHPRRGLVPDFGHAPWAERGC